MRRQLATTAWPLWSSACRNPDGVTTGDRPGGRQRGKEGGGIFPEAPKLEPLSLNFPPETPQLSGFSEGRA